MKIKTSELTGAALDWAVAKCEGFTDYNHATETMMPPRKEYGRVNLDEYSYSTDWARGGPIIERERMDIKCWDFHSMPWKASMWWDDENTAAEIQAFGPTPLIAAMRCYVASKLGDEVEIPEELK